MKKLLILSVCLSLAIFSSSAAKFEPTWPLFQGAPDDTFASWVADRVSWPEDPATAAVEDFDPANLQPFIFHFTVDESGSVVDFSSEEYPAGSVRSQLQTILASSPAWTPAYVRRKKSAPTDYYLVIRPAERTIALSSSRTGDQIMPKFQDGGIPEFSEWVRRSFIFPNEAVRNDRLDVRVVARFAVEPDGRTTVLEVIESPHEALSREISRVIITSPRWTPGSVAGIPVRIDYVLPVKFNLRSSSSLFRSR